MAADTATNTISTLNETISTLESKIEELQAAVTELEHNLATEKSKADAAARASDNMTRRLRDAEATPEAHRLKAEAAFKTGTELQVVVTELETQASKANDKFSKLRAEAHDKILKLRNHIKSSELDAAHQKAKTQERDSSEKFSKLRDEANDKLSKLRDDIKSIREEAKAQASSLEAEKSTLSTRIDRLL
ncbi:hypothetical protein P171DRAFT_484753 [Karstenula rhodostoma CBS 690.94]|uniref:Uncharacterized protein n=1 Tax=Karstenula rhodostoma CBS 690.94 TaxID=1392251 RepID=A0A9P4PKS0_9PLEO|nr:hypothetical protein P171DRAFT_484753 [Karstenula rhodostoma CBS 690.94]